MNIDRQLTKISSISTIAELDGYEAEARSRGITGDELRALLERRKVLTKRKGKRNG